jgi:membrane-bound lytic murein transglycosylase D
MRLRRSARDLAVPVVLLLAGGCVAPHVITDRLPPDPPAAAELREPVRTAVTEPAASPPEPASLKVAEPPVVAAGPKPPAVEAAPDEARQATGAPPDLATYVREAVRRDFPEVSDESVSAVEEPVRDDFADLVSPEDDRLIEDLADKLPAPVPPPEAPTPAPEKAAAPEAESAAPAMATPVPPAYDIPIEFNTQVLGYIELYRTVKRPAFERGLVRVKVYEKMMKRILAEEGVPQDLYYLALIESAYNPKAYSRARAMGPWQFIESTGRLYELNRDWWADERRDPEKSTRAAARHLRDLKAEFGSWTLAMAAYNCGVGRVRRAMKAKPGADFWSLKLPKQTRNYVPAFMAATVIAKDPERHGFFLDYDPPIEYDRVTVTGSTDLDIVAECAGCTVDEIRALNPEILRWCTPPTDGDYSLAVPAGAGERFVEAYAQVPPARKVRWKRYQIARGDSFSSIARRFGIPAAAIAEANDLKLTSTIRTGAYLLIPFPGAEAGGSIDREETRKVAAIVSPSKDAAARVRIAYRVRPGDTLWDIAQRHGVTVKELEEWNPGAETLRLGDQLTVWSRRASVAEPPMSSKDFRRQTTYQIKRGDTLWSISRKFDTDMDDLCRANGLTSRRVTLTPGRTLTIPGNI